MNRIIILLTTVFFVLPISFLGIAAVYWDPWTMRIYESISPRGYGEAVFVENHSIKDYSTRFYIRDPAESSKLILVGNFDSDDYPLMQVLWSRDGSVVATRAAISSSGKSYGVFFTAAYDFKQHGRKQRISGFTSVRSFSGQIERLLNKRGGVIPATTTQPTPISPWRWKRQAYY